MDGAWLFVRARETIWLQRTGPAGRDLLMHGPAGIRRQYTFRTELDLAQFLRDIEERLVTAGWTVERFEAGRDRRVGVDRRRQRRVAERRRAG